EIQKWKSVAPSRTLSSTLIACQQCDWQAGKHIRQWENKVATDGNGLYRGVSEDIPVPSTGESTSKKKGRISPGAATQGQSARCVESHKETARHCDDCSPLQIARECQDVPASYPSGPQRNVVALRKQDSMSPTEPQRAARDEQFHPAVRWIFEKE